ncbi:hypothetical protein ANOM_009464 [Aspergillus nomiae NRRL 13137]|uniref:Uncharacterized protein n=1 Tax=Aspergillus nomiae NRRL (strain ATCC 15546 / NRRL 13137 / CBS 260.88 / M93) TaxID=1509407 RepID=A0A0L1IU08_ASPN3|nr:uncharacterized protein ANOM_009464 [Aspergillus nomiae NRRL 13137]KNG82944.1 hypothetical protein ANOM_009464 [Aspergillus nomiae NRRL 13137]
MLPIIISTGTAKADADTRKLIRSHVMLGKNRGKYRRSGRVDRAELEHDETCNEKHRTLRKQSRPLTKRPPSIIPQTVGSEVSLLQFADTVEPALAVDIVRFSAMSKRTLFTLERYLSFQKKNDQWHDLLIVDPVYLHGMAFITQDFFDGLSGWQSEANKPASLHFLKTLQLLRERLALPDEQAKTSDATIMVVLFLTTHAHVKEDLDSAKHHLRGLRKIVDLRGGMANLTYDVNLKTEIYRSDLSIALQGCTRPLFFDDHLLHSMLTAPTMGKHANEQFLENIDDDLARTWSIMKRFCVLVNEAISAQQRLSMDFFMETMTSVMYRLLHIKFETGSIAEAIRLGLLAFSSHVFLQWQDIRRQYIQFSTTFKESLMSLKDLDGVSSHIVLWLLIVGGISVFSTADDAWLKPWLRANSQLCKVNSWPAMRDVLESFMWIGVIHDKSGKDLFESALLQPSPEVYLPSV